MVNSVLKNGTKILVVRTEHFVKCRDFAIALTEKFYGERKCFDKSITKKNAEEILKRSLFFYGLQGQFEDGYFEASFEEGERYNAIYSDATEWIKSKYSWFSDNPS